MHMLLDMSKWDMSSPKGLPCLFSVVTDNLLQGREHLQEAPYGVSIDVSNTQEGQRQVGSCSKHSSTLECTFKLLNAYQSL